MTAMMMTMRRAFSHRFYSAFPPLLPFFCFVVSSTLRSSVETRVKHSLYGAARKERPAFI